LVTAQGAYGEEMKQIFWIVPKVSPAVVIRNTAQNPNQGGNPNGGNGGGNDPGNGGPGGGDGGTIQINPGNNIIPGGGGSQ
jgi:hypothetical protein